ncbi:phospho-N-acetylmuramoyl-pentapeptide-transferase [Fibrobacter sp. UWS1]|uniref:phospho-N-acetylmuramoyl-pentapeptide- transferase n=1 Tax=Fibrobacter sp. UWS1 TaxID=1896220 RepID=UPI000BB13D7B|nr:phospho-N-acetylmuramoyl-pentapeptide-transferase [Fibrobacter sp. UWS1]PBC67851.1 phospho-N-acetylmuramoyl-pentapeptide-transferase [Fibrobacter sp. UWS1]
MLCEWIYHLTDIPLFDSRLFRAGIAALLSILLVLTTMPPYIRFLQKTDATSDFDQNSKVKAPPIMGGVLLVVVVGIVSLLTCKLNGYTISTLLVLVAFSSVGAIDDLAKVKTKRLIAQGKATAASYMEKADGISSSVRLGLYFLFSLIIAIFCYKFIPDLRGHLTVPFVPVDVFQIHLPNWAFIGFMTFVIAATANGTNFTDGLDSLVSVPILTSMVFVGVVAYVCGNFIFSNYLNMPFLPGCDELFPLATSIAGALLAYLWFNSPPAEIYMGDAGSVGFGAAIGIMFILVQAGLFLPLVCIIIIAEACSVLLQISWFKATKKMSGEGKRLFLCAPLHHHYQKKWDGHFASKPLMNSKIVWRMHLVSIFALIVSFVIFFGIR